MTTECITQFDPRPGDAVEIVAGKHRGKTGTVGAAYSNGPAGRDRMVAVDLPAGPRVVVRLSSLAATACRECGHELMAPSPAGEAGDDSWYCEGCGTAWSLDLSRKVM